MKFRRKPAAFFFLGIDQESHAFQLRISRLLKLLSADLEIDIESDETNDERQSADPDSLSALPQRCLPEQYLAAGRKIALLEAPAPKSSPVKDVGVATLD